MNWKTNYSLIILGISLMFPTTACETTEPFKVTDKVIENTNLHEVVNSRVYVAYLDPSVDFSRYKKILVLPLNFDNVKIEENYDSPRNVEFELNEKDKAMLDGIYQDMMLKYLQEKGDFQVVKSPGADVLTLSVFVLQIRPNAPKDDFKSRGSGRGVTVYSEGAGSITIAASVNDSMSGKTVAQVADSKASTSMWGINNRVSNTQDVSIIFGQWAQQLNNALKSLQTYKIER